MQDPGAPPRPDELDPDSKWIPPVTNGPPKLEKHSGKKLLLGSCLVEFRFTELWPRPSERTRGGIDRSENRRASRGRKPRDPGWLERKEGWAKLGSGNQPRPAYSR